MQMLTEEKRQMRTKIKQIKFPKGDSADLVGQKVTVKAWVKTVRFQKKFAFLELNDGSTLTNLQVIVDESLANYHSLKEELSTGCSVAVTGTIKESMGKKQSFEIHAENVIVIGTCDPATYPLQKKRHTFEYLRSIAHLRPRTNTLGAVMRVRNALGYATHQYFQEKGFLYLNSPIITASDCEGAGEMFRVSTLNPNKLPKDEEGQIDYSKDFFERPTFLTVSGQLNAEIYALALSDVYTFGPTFRSENSNTKRHLAEFWMIEPEMAFADLNDDADSAEEYLKYVLRYALEHCQEDMHFFDKFISNGLVERIEHIVNSPFERMSYTYAVRVLERAKKSFEFPVKWGIDLQTEHERYLAEEFVGKPVVVTDYPKDIKAFYMRMNDDNKTVAAMDILVPTIGEIVGGSQREERLGALETRLLEMNLPKEDYWWYLELRKYGSVPHAGYGVGFERLVLLATGMENIRDVIPFPRSPGQANF
jgi:asparaginyl-tRNA synthetase